MKHSYLITFSAIIVFGIGMLIATAEVPEWVTDGSWSAAREKPVLVVLVGSKRNVQSVRAAISDDRVIAETEYAFALYEERIIAANADAATVPLSLAGWVDRKIDLVAVPMDGGRRWMRQREQGETGATGDGDAQTPEQAQRIAELMNKPSLTAGEAMALLQHMDSTGQF